MDDVTILRILFCGLIVSAWLNILTTWLWRRRLKAQCHAMANFYAELATNRRADAAIWETSARNTPLPSETRRRAIGLAFNAMGNASALEDVANDIRRVFVDGKPLDSRHVIAPDEPTPESTPTPARKPRQTVVFTSKGGDA